ncbi:MAG TPA: pyridoxal phosphate-dependent aminotransferase, partial [Candidatus Saccharimonadales bacterium]|nr:pyridoxal phosphate-dependent aminotransferase [Candidatus Saccharimonadales bacterium]
KELMFILQLVYYGDLIIPTPTWVSYAPQAQIIGRHVRWLPTEPGNGWQMTARQLDALCSEDPGRPRIVILNYPANPTGHTYDAGRLERIARVARRYRVILLSDEIYGKLHHDGEHVSIVPMYPEGTIYSGGISKWCGAGGWRLGVFVFPPGLQWLRDGMAAVASETFTSTSAPIQYAAIRAFQEDPELKRYLDGSRAILKALGNELAERLRRSGAHVAAPQGGFYLFPDFTAHTESLRAKRIRSGTELCERLLQETGVAILPGSAFGRPEDELTARISYVNFDGAAALDALGDDAGRTPPDVAFLERHCAETLEAVDILCRWVTG